MRWALALVLLLVGCPETGAGAKEVRVLAAASLTTPLGAIAAGFEQSHPGTHVELSFGSSTAHERQIEAGAACDVFIAASHANVDRLAAAGLVDSASRTVVARNGLVVIVPRGEKRPADVAGLREVSRVAVGGRGVPVGEYARAALAGVIAEEKLAGYPDEPAVVTAVSQGGAPAGVCYSSSLASHPQRDHVERAFALEPRSPIEYPAVVPRAARTPDLARAFIEFIRGEGRAELVKNGFQE